MSQDWGETTQIQRSIVSVERVTDDVEEAVRRALERAGARRAIPGGADVALKVNLGWDLFIPGSITSPLVAEATIRALSDWVGQIHVVEADQVLEDIESAFQHSGMAEVCRRTGARWHNMSANPTRTVEAPDNRVLRRVELSALLADTVLVTLPVLKTHAKTRISGALKNQWGCLPKSRHEYHLQLDDAIADINTLCRPALALMDGTIGLEGDGPKSGWPRVMDRILCSTDPVALDSVEAQLMSIDPASVRHLATCAARGLGEFRPEAIEIAGEPEALVRVPFRNAQHNAVSQVENLLRGSMLKRLFFDTPIFQACLWGAKVYYRAWAQRHRRACFEVARAHPVYGPQWRSVGPA